jgi:TonB family protein
MIETTKFLQSALIISVLVHAGVGTFGIPNMGVTTHSHVYQAPEVVYCVSQTTRETTESVEPIYRPVRVSKEKKPAPVNFTKKVEPLKIQATSPKLTAKKIKSSPVKDEKTAILKPIVENVDLRNQVVRSIFYNYYELLSKLIARFAVYPYEAKQKGQHGVVYVSFLLKNNGTIRELFVQHSSGFGVLDVAAISAIQNAAPFPPLPLELQGKEIRLHVPVSFEIE